MSTNSSNQIANAQFSQAEIAAFVGTDFSKSIDYAIQRNPTTVYQFIQLNFPGLLVNVAPGGETTAAFMGKMSSFLNTQIANMSAIQQQAFNAALLISLPDAAQFANWTTPGTPINTTTTSTLN